jgi:hypothetical protein
LLCKCAALSRKIGQRSLEIVGRKRYFCRKSATSERVQLRRLARERQVSA